MTAKNRFLMVSTALVLAAPLALWGLLGQQNDTGVPASELTYTIEPPALAAGTETALGVFGLLLALVSTAVLVRANLRGSLAVERWWTLLPLVAAGLIVAGGWRVLTTGSADANIGAGLVVLFGTPTVLTLIGLSTVPGLLRSRR
ncbi:hypothetical protein [Streptomyces yaizuensis]|uniref:Uncharacterized protein n=1 Tax=Streptomyces yaizuensis TaxID=2989713 RepID=A0ABQ5PBM3_9ACTN|nr:hypothetical protein [Streptomyces sp. YSPA8]GLF99636.1 hypothetical protein SYYSPA8_35085 [Streptomyces sp. YSPA8]